MVILGDTRCCGVFELDNISSMSSAQGAFMGAVERIRRLPINFPFVTFSGVVELAPGIDALQHARGGRSDNYGEALAKFIEKHRCGKIIRSSPKRSWSGNVIQLWIWEIDRERAYPLHDKLLKEIEDVD